MKEIIIPLLNITLKINPIAFTIFGISVYWYAILIVLSIIIAIYIYYKNDKKYGINYEDIIDLALILIPISFLCARIYYVIFKLDYYKTFEKIINIKDGGAVITSYIFCKKRNIKFTDLLDYIVICLPLRTSNR